VVKVFADDRSSWSENGQVDMSMKMSIELELIEAETEDQDTWRAEMLFVLGTWIPTRQRFQGQYFLPKASLGKTRIFPGLLCQRRSLESYTISRTLQHAAHESLPFTG